jgi:UDP-N-acetylglucosamine transferase subunit ALG13
VCDSGSGIIGVALRNGRRPLMLPRRHGAGEPADDHQIQIARKLKELDLAVALDERIEADHVSAAARPLPEATTNGVPSVADALRAAIASGRIPA